LNLVGNKFEAAGYVDRIIPYLRTHSNY